MTNSRVKLVYTRGNVLNGKYIFKTLTRGNHELLQYFYTNDT